MTTRFLTFIDNAIQLVTAIASSAGIADANKIVATGVDGKIDASLITGSAVISGTANFDFGLQGDTVVSVISSLVLTSANFKGVSFIPVATADHSIDDYPFEGIVANLENIVDGISFDLRASSPHVSYGIYSFNYRIIY